MKGGVEDKVLRGAPRNCYISQVVSLNIAGDKEEQANRDCESSWYRFKWRHQLTGSPF